MSSVRTVSVPLPLDDPAVSQPLVESDDPLSHGPFVARAESESVSAGPEDVQLRRHDGAFESNVHVYFFIPGDVQLTT